MGKLKRLISPNIAKLMSPEARREHGITTPEEDAIKDRKRHEKELQSHVVDLLAQRRVVYIRPPMNRKSALPPGWPDFTFAYQGFPVAWEVKTGYAQPSDEQLAMHQAMRRNGWIVTIIRSVEQALGILNELDQRALTRVAPALWGPSASS